MRTTSILLSLLLVSLSLAPTASAMTSQSYSATYPDQESTKCMADQPHLGNCAAGKVTASVHCYYVGTTWRCDGTIRGDLYVTGLGVCGDMNVYGSSIYLHACAVGEASTSDSDTWTDYPGKGGQTHHFYWQVCVKTLTGSLRDCSALFDYAAFEPGPVETDVDAVGLASAAVDYTVSTTIGLLSAIP